MFEIGTGIQRTVMVGRLGHRGHIIIIKIP